MFNNSKKIIERNSKIIYYDCTNYFFEIDQDDDLRKYGVSKEHRPNPIVSMGLFMDGDDFPLSFNIYPGNKNEQTTLIPEENKIFKNFKLRSTKTILCTDAGLASDEIKKYNVQNGQNGRAFVITQSLKKLKENYQDEVFNTKNWKISGDLKNTYDLEKINQTMNLKKNITILYFIK